jgi:hypothetical protein
MARRGNVCAVKGCGRNVVPEDGDEYPQGNLMRSLCSRCNAARYYWRRREEDNPEAVIERRNRLKFFSTRLGWLFDKGGIE